MSQVAELEKSQTSAGLSQLDQLKRYSKVVADTGDFVSFREYQPQDATTNPSLILTAAQMPEYHDLVQQAIAAQRSSGLTGQALISRIVDEL